MGRPIRHDGERRRRAFVTLVAAGVRLDEAARQAKLDPWRALRLVDSPEMRDMLTALTGRDVSTLRDEV